MIADYGFLLLLFAFIASLYSSLASLTSGYLRSRPLFYSAKMAATCASVLLVGAAILMWFLLFTHDYSAGYVYRNSSNDLPLIFTITAFWSALEGSHLLWTVLISVYGTIALYTHSKDNEHIMPQVCFALQGVLAWMCYLAATASDPFAISFPPAENGLGMNELLQNPYMAIHPPSLFTGYTALAIPFAYALAALAYGDITQGWLRTVRRWSLFAWTFLTIGVFLGGRWAYVELGWAGYWAWDPVENSSLMPWLLCTCLLHSLLVQEKIGHLKRLTIVLSIGAFFMSFLGTFITRSGIVSSVHSFAQSPVGHDYLYFLLGLTSISLYLYWKNAPTILPDNAEKRWGMSKESALIVTQFILLTLTAIVMIGTLYPIVSEAITGSRFNVQAPYFNSFAPYIGLALIIAITIGNLIHYNKNQLVGGTKLQIKTLLISVPLTLTFAHYADVFRSTGFPFAAQVVGIYLCFWAIMCLSFDVYFRLKELSFNYQLLFKRNLAFLGAYVAHIGIIIGIIGFLGNYRGLEKIAVMKSGDHLQFYGYDFQFTGMTLRKDQNVDLLTAPLKYSRNNQELGYLYPAKAKYPTKDQLFHEIDFAGTFWHDVYVVLADFQTNGKEVTLEIHINPTVRLVWLSGIIMALGGLLCFLDRRRGLNKKEAITTSGGLT